jgi:hypothetical protein
LSARRNDNFPSASVSQGIAVHTRSGDGVANGARTDLGSRLQFEPELGIGYRVSDRVTIEASWAHISNAQLLSRQNPGMDSVGFD